MSGPASCVGGGVVKTIDATDYEIGNEFLWAKVPDYFGDDARSIYLSVARDIDFRQEVDRELDEPE